MADIYTELNSPLRLKIKSLQTELETMREQHQFLNEQLQENQFLNEQLQEKRKTIRALKTENERLETGLQDIKSDVIIWGNFPWGLKVYVVHTDEYSAGICGIFKSEQDAQCCSYDNRGSFISEWRIK